MAKQPLKKKEVEKSSFKSFKTKTGLTNVQNADKPLSWLVMPTGYQEALKLPGIPEGYVTDIVGHSNVGKSTIINHAIVAAQEKGRIPVIYDTENNFDFTYAINMGFKAEPVYNEVEEEIVDIETGEVKIVKVNKLMGYDGDFLYFSNTLLADRYGDFDYSQGKTVKTKRTVAVIEDIAASINELLDAQDSGEIDADFLFVWDSVGSIGSFKSYKSHVGNNMFDAGAISAAFQSIINHRIPGSRKVLSPHINTMVLINKVWLDSMTNPVSPPSLSLKGGNSIFYASRLIILLGGQLKASTKKLIATSSGANYNYGIETKIKVLKNQLPAPYTITYEGTVLCTAHGMLAPHELEGYKKSHIADILKQLKDMIKNGVEINESDIVFSSEDDDSVVG
jgi:hypothetical protein